MDSVEKRKAAARQRPLSLTAQGGAPERWAPAKSQLCIHRTRRGLGCHREKASPATERLVASCATRRRSVSSRCCRSERFSVWSPYQHSPKQDPASPRLSLCSSLFHRITRTLRNHKKFNTLHQSTIPSPLPIRSARHLQTLFTPAPRFLETPSRRM